MFKVGNADFIADKLASELLPDQEFREVKKNAREALDRLSGGESNAVGRIEFDVDWMMRRETGNWYISCADDGDGMNRIELERYMTTLAVEGANRNQSITGNQGMGLKISGPTRHKEGLLIRSLKSGEATMVQVGWNKHSKEYGLIPVGQEGELVVSIPEEFFPEFIRARGSGTVVTFLGNSELDNTFKPANRANGWLFKYLNRRFFRVSQDGVTVVVRVPSGEVDEWPSTVEEAEERMAGRGGKSFNLSKVNGTGEVWDSSAEKNGEENGSEPTRGIVDVAGDPGADQPPARIHWWVLTNSGSDVSTRTASGGSIAVLYQNELHDWRSSSQANPYFARMGVLFGKTRVGIIIEPLGGNVTSDFARAHVLIGGTPVFEHDALLTWADQFRSQMPEAIRDAMQEEQARIQSEDPDRAKRIRERLKDVMALLRPRRFRRNPDGSLTATGNPVTGSGGNDGEFKERYAGGTGQRGTAAGTRGIGAVLSQIGEAGDSASEIFSILQIDPLWVTEKEADGMPIVNGDDRGLQDRAAALSGEDGVSASRLLLNKQFRGYQVIIDAMNEWANSEGDEGKAQFIEKIVQEWIEQKMVEAVIGLRQLENGSTWTAMSFDDAFSPVALTVAFMADRYHTLREVKRQIGSIKVASSSEAVSST